MPAQIVRRLAISLVLAALSGCAGPASPAGDPPLAGAKIGGPFELVDAAGKTVRWSDFVGKYRMLYFGYAYCPDVCPFEVQRMMQGYNAFKEQEPDLAAQVQPIFVSIDPERDTPAKVGEFARAFSADLMGLTGTPKQVDRAAKAFAVYYAKGPVGADGKNYMMDHSPRAVFLMGREGEPIALLPVEKNDKGAAVAAELQRWVS